VGVKGLVAFKCVMAERQKPRQRERNFTGVSMASLPVIGSRVRVHRHDRTFSIIAQKHWKSMYHISHLLEQPGCSSAVR